MPQKKKAKLISGQGFLSFGRGAERERGSDTSRGESESAEIADVQLTITVTNAVRRLLQHRSHRTSTSSTSSVSASSSTSSELTLLALTKS